MEITSSVPGTPAELSTLAADLVNAAEASARERAATQIFTVLNEVHRVRMRDPEADQLATLKEVVHAQNDALITVATLISAARAYARDRDDSETDRLLENIGCHVNAVADAFADHI